MKCFANNAVMLLRRPVTGRLGGKGYGIREVGGKNAWWKDFEAK